MNDSIIFVPVCPKCHHVFEQIDVGYDFNIICPKCKAVFNSISCIDFKKLSYTDSNNKTRFNYNQSEYYHNQSEQY